MATKAKHQTGQVIERSGAFYIRYYSTQIKDGKPIRKRVSDRLCEKDWKHKNTTCKAVKDLGDKFMVDINKNSARVNPQDVVITEFWTDKYLPWCEQNLRQSSVYGYKKLWKSLLEPHFAGRTFSEYETHHGSEFLTSLTKTLGRNSISHVRSLSSAMFSHAVNLGIIAANPWREVKVLAKLKETPETEAYSLSQAEAILNALAERVDAQAVFSLAFFMGLRPSEIAGLQWSDVEDDQIWIRRGVVRGAVDKTKTRDSVAPVLLIDPVRSLLAVWRFKSLGSDASRRSHGDGGGVPSVGVGDWVFPSKKGPLNVESFCFHVIKPRLAKAEVKWSGLYSARRGNGTILTELTGNALSAQSVLRHKSILTTASHYIKASSASGIAGLKLLEAHAGSNKEK